MRWMNFCRLFTMSFGELRRINLRPNAKITRFRRQNRLHFFSIAAEMMRRILVTHAIAKKAEKRGSGDVTISLDDLVTFPNKQDIDLVSLDETLKELAELDERQAKTVELKFFGGLTNEEIAEVLGISDSTVKREWRSAKAWLLSRIK
jgi:RNA polymerase sigma-70 factor, ECF subfamily